ncbi:MAG TPA: hypothetical protein VFR18_26615, partial [Terriglobia bacterium]|nr:hypothetical protein [Terriglobia bacterium]
IGRQFHATPRAFARLERTNVLVHRTNPDELGGRIHGRRRLLRKDPDGQQYRQEGKPAYSHEVVITPD